MSHDHYYFCTQSVVNKVHPQLIKRSLCTIILSGNTMARVLWNLPLFLLIYSYINAIGTSEITYYTVCTVSWHYAHMPFIATLVVRLSHVYKLVLNMMVLHSLLHQCSAILHIYAKYNVSAPLCYHHLQQVTWTFCFLLEASCCFSGAR